MRRRLTILAVPTALVAVLVLASVMPSGAGGSRNIRADLNGYEEVPAVSTVAAAQFRAEFSEDGESVDWALAYADLEGSVTQAHLHFGQPAVSGGISVFLCSNLGNGPAGTQACPPSGTIGGTFTASSVVGPSTQGIAAAEYGELVAAIRAGMVYANVHSTKWQGGEVRGQVRDGGGGVKD